MKRRAPSQFYALRSTTEHARANRELRRLFRDRGARRAMVRFHEGPLETLHLPELDLWFAAHALANRYRNAFGPGDPVGRRTLWPSIQFNLALRPGSARPHARFFRDADDRMWIAHTGTLGGRQPGISREGFLALLGGAREVTIDGAHEQLVVLGTFADPQPLLGELARLTHTAHQYREALAAGLVA